MDTQPADSGRRSEEELARLAAIPRRLLKDLYLVNIAKEALTEGRCPDCRSPLTVIDTWERECPQVGCGYSFNLYHWPYITAPLPPDDAGGKSL